MQRIALVAFAAVLTAWLAESPAGGQVTGSVVGWGVQVVLPPEQLDLRRRGV